LRRRRDEQLYVAVRYPQNKSPSVGAIVKLALPVQLELRDKYFVRRCAASLWDMIRGIYFIFVYRWIGSVVGRSFSVFKDETRRGVGSTTIRAIRQFYFAP